MNFSHSMGSVVSVAERIQLAKFDDDISALIIF